MKKIVIASIVLFMVSEVTLALESLDGEKLNGPHYTLNIVGVKNPKKVDWQAKELEHGLGGVIFVNLSGPSKIGLIDSDEVEGLDPWDFAVLDKNGTDNDGALFALPKPGYDDYEITPTPGDSPMSDYSIYVRPLGKPLGNAKITTCADVSESYKEYLSSQNMKILNDPCVFGGYASVEQVGTGITTREKGKTSFTNVTAELTSIVFKIEVYDDSGALIDTIYVRVPIFDDKLENEYWYYDNDGLKVLQVRIYPWGTDLSYADDKLFN